MLDLACIFTTGGVILFCKTFCEIGLDFVNEFIFNILVQEKLNEKQFKLKDRVFIWRYDQEIKVIFLFVYQELFKSLDFQEVLSYTKSYYKKTIWPEIGKNGDLIVYIPEFESHFDKIIKAFVKKNTKDSGQNTKPDVKRDSSSKVHQPDEDDAGESDGEEEHKETATENVGSLQNQERTSGILKSSNRDSISGEPGNVSPKRVGFREDTQDRPEPAVQSPSPDKGDPGRKLTPKEIMEKKIAQKREAKLAEKEKSGKLFENQPKQERTWGASEKITEKAMKSLDYSEKFSKSAGADKPEEKTANMASYFEKDEELDLDFEIISDDEHKADGKKTKKSGILSSFKNSFKSLTEGKVLTDNDLKKILEKFKEDLMSKNVAEEIARNIVDSLKVKLINQKIQVFSSVTELVKTTLKETLTKILTPKKNYDILSEASKVRETGEPYVIAFIGVNGVGKSTNLAKVAYLFKSQGFSVMFAACDNFRAGAVEQLKTHGRALDIPVYDRGYKDEPHRIAKEAIREAKSRKIDVVLIDTAGRMQNNEPLMRALAKLVSVNNPNMVVFIGEALVGNDGVDQLTSFNSALIKYSTEEKERREIDAILISKFDTVDEKGRIIS
jgi:signal recognition particle receptor subunit alpha